MVESTARRKRALRSVGEYGRARRALSTLASAILVAVVIVAGLSVLIYSARSPTSAGPSVVEGTSTSTTGASESSTTVTSSTATNTENSTAATTTGPFGAGTTTTSTYFQSSTSTRAGSSTSTATITSYPGLITALICAGCTVYTNPPYTFPTNVTGACAVASATRASGSTLFPPSSWPYTDDKFVWTIGYSTGGVDQLMSANVAPDGSLKTQVCLSCNNPNAPPLDLFKHAPSLRPQGDWILLDVENPNGPIINQSSSVQLQVERNNGYYTNLWVTKADGSRWYQLTNFTAPAGGNPGAVGILSPVWSPDGKMVAFSETYKAPDEANLQGYWNLYAGNFEVNNSTGVPFLANVTNIDYPGDVFYEVQTFSPDSTQLVVQSVTPGMNAYGVDLYTVNLVPGPNFGKYTDITNSPYSWDEHAVYSPSGQKIAWISSLPFPNIIPEYGTLHWADYRDYLHNEFFLMNANGTGVQQLTWFNTPGNPESSPQFGDAMYGEWNLAGTQLLIHNGTPEIQVPGGNSEWLITFAGACGG